MTTAISAKELEQGVVFEIPHGHDFDDFFDDEMFNTYKTDLKNLSQKNKYQSGIAPFADIKKNMKPITEDGLVLKEDIKHGIGIVLPESCLVIFHYEGFTEGRSEPFDSSKIRDKPYKCLIGDGNLLPGLELGVRSMRKGEQARFIVDSSYAFGEMGCPPRIPGGASILYEVEIINFFPAKDVIEFEDMTPEDQKKAPFEKILGVYQCENMVANDLYSKKAYKPAVARYKKVVRLLEDVSVKDEEEDDKRNECLLKLYLNLAQCYLCMQVPQKTITYAGLALKLNRNNVKGLFRMGKALFMVEDYDRADYYLSKAKQHKPYEASINAAIVKLHEKRKLYEDWFARFSRNALPSLGSTVQKPPRSKAMEEFFQYLNKEVAEFVNTDEKEMLFSPGSTEEQQEIIKEVAQLHDLAFVSKIMMGRKIIKIVKKNVS